MDIQKYTYIYIWHILNYPWKSDPSTLAIQWILKELPFRRDGNHHFPAPKSVPLLAITLDGPLVAYKSPKWNAWEEIWNLCDWYLKTPKLRRYVWNVFPRGFLDPFGWWLPYYWNAIKIHQTVSPWHWPTSMNSIRGRLPQFRWPRQLSVYGSPWPLKKGTLPPTISKIHELRMEHNFCIFKRGHGFVSGFSQTWVSTGQTFVQSEFFSAKYQPQSWTKGAFRNDDDDLQVWNSKFPGIYV